MFRYNPGRRSYAQNRARIARSIRAAGPKSISAYSAVSLEAEPAANVERPDAVITQDGTEIPLMWDVG